LRGAETAFKTRFELPFSAAPLSVFRPYLFSIMKIILETIYFNIDVITLFSIFQYSRVSKCLNKTYPRKITAENGKELLFCSALQQLFSAYF
jgi:positive regulator of sigma E activity